MLVREAYSDPQLRHRLGLRGTVTFESHTNLGNDQTISESLEKLSIDGEDEASTAPILKGRRKARGKGNRADQFCVYRSSDGSNIPSVAIEYKAPHKLRRDEIVTGLESEIRPERDIINKDGEGFVFASKKLATAVITQLFSYMVGKGIQYGYLCNGEVFVFVHIPDDPSIVYYSVCVPNLDVLDGDDARIHRTAVGQVFAFVLQALRSDLPPMSWHDRAADLDLWAVEYEDVLRNIPETVRKTPRASPYKPGPWRHFKRSPIMLRSRCQPPTDKDEHWEDDDEDEDKTDPASPTQGRWSKSTQSRAGTLSIGKENIRQAKASEEGAYDQRTRKPLGEQPYCTQQCLLGLACCGPMDKTCPNFVTHGKQRLGLRKFLALVRSQLACDRGLDADCQPLHLSGRHGSLFKVRLSSHGYTFVAKGVEQVDVTRLRRESRIYDKLQSLQGRHVPVCLGNIDLVRPYYYDSGVFVMFMLLGWAGRPLFESVNADNKSSVVKGVTTAFTQLHQLRLLHRDAAPRNVLYDAHSGNVMVVDFERAAFHHGLPLQVSSGNGQSRKRKQDVLSKSDESDFTRELQATLASVSRCAESPVEPIRLSALAKMTNQGIEEGNNALSRTKENIIMDDHAAEDAIHLMVSTTDQPFRCKTPALGSKGWQIGGSISDMSVQHVLRDMLVRNETESWPREGLNRSEMLNWSMNGNEDVEV